MDRLHRRRETVAATLTALGLCAGVWLIDNSPKDTSPPQPSAAEAVRPDPAEKRNGVEPLPSSVPVRVRIPAIAVDAPVTGLGLERDGSLQAPPEGDANLTGWYRDGTSPGAPGTAIIAGHVDNSDGPAVFYGLGSLKKGNTVRVDRADGRAAVFTIHAIEVHDRENFPDDRVYGPSDRPELRVITCGGGFSRADGYTGNVVVYAHLTGTR